MPKLRALGAGCVLMFIGLAPTLGFAQECDPWVARLLSLQGSVEVKREDSARWLPASLGQEYCFGDQLRVGAHSRASVELNNDTILRLDQKSTLILPEPTGGDLSFVELLQGALHLISRIRGRLEIRTPFVNAGLEGTEFVVRVHDAETVVAVIEGQVRVSNALGSLQLTDGQTASGTKTAAPVLRLDLKPEDAVQWAIHYPLITDPAAPGLAAGIAEAQRLLQVGRVPEAKAVIDDILPEDPGNSDAMALAAIIELAQNRKAAALALAERAVAEGESGAALTALSYAQQAGFELQAARATAARATQQFPDQALLWARLAELQASLGQRKEAVASAQRAVELDPELSRTQTVLGFALLNRSNIADARKALGKAIALDSGDPLPRLGLGLLKIREGDLAQGRRDMEIAITLDPSQSLTRSYLGKAYLEEGRSDEAEAEFELARQFDPLDPTSRLYSSQLELSMNRPGAALQDIQSSIRVNDNRAVYRSRLLLDRDLATRTSSQGAIFRALGFEDLGALQGHESLARDPANFSAHYLLADSYAALPRHEIATTSEQHQALRLSPPNAASIQPQAAFSNLSIPKNAEMRSVSFNEFGPLFSTDGNSFQANGLIGSNDTWGDHLIVSGLHGRFGYSLGQFHYETDGYRVNNDLEHDILSLFANMGLSAGSHVQLEYKRRESNFGDLSMLFDPDAADPNDRRTIDESSVTLAGYHELTAGKSLLGSLTYVDRSVDILIDDRSSFFGSTIGVLIDQEVDTEGIDAELQFIHRSDRLSSVYGVRHVDLDRSANGQQTIFDPFFGPQQTTIDQGDSIRISRGYVYNSATVSPTTRITVGLSVDDIDDPVRNSVELNPKAGLSIQLSDSTRLRASATRTVASPLAAKRTLEPTQVAGFNQFFDDPTSTISKRFGLGLDHRFSDAAYAGIEVTARDLEIPISSANVIEERDRDERWHNVYFNWLPIQYWAARIGYAYESIDNAEEWGVDIPREIETHTLSGGLKLTHPNGIIAGLGARYVDQEVGFSGTNADASGQERFWIVDASLGWRLPGRRGVIEVGVNNLLDQEFRYQHPYFGPDTSEPPRSLFQPEQFLYLRGVLNF